MSAAIVVRAQSTITGAFFGKVSNSQTGLPVKGALVEIINQQNRIVFSEHTNYRGEFFRGELLPGNYIVRVSMAGYRNSEVPQPLRITNKGEVIPVPVSLDPIGAPITAPTLTLEDTEIRSLIIRIDGRRSGSHSDQEVITLPLGGSTSTRSFDELALLLPGAAPPPQTLGSVAGPGVGAGVGSAGQFSANGLRSRGNNFTVDGSDNNDEDIGVRRQGFVALVPQPIESIQEYQATTLLAPAQYGRNIGAQVNAVSKSGGSETHGTIYGFFNSSQLNAQNFFEVSPGNGFSTIRANNQDVLVQTRDANGVVISQQPLTVRNPGRGSYTFWQGGLVLGGPLRKKSTFYFVSLEREVTNSTEQESFGVPTVDQRGAFRTGATGIFRNALTAQPTSSIPTSRNGAAILSLYPFPNNPNGVYGANTFSEVLPANGQGTVLSGKIDHYLLIGGEPQTLTGRYNFTDDWRDIPVTGSALFSTIKPRIRTQNFSFFVNGKLNGSKSAKSIFNQFRLSFGRTRLKFDEVRDNQYLIPSQSFRGVPFLLNAPELLDITLPVQAGVPNAGPAIYLHQSPAFQSTTVESEIGPVGQINISGFSPMGVDVYNFPQRRVNNTYQIADQLTVGVGNHSMMFGADNRRTELNSELPRNARPLLTFGGAPRLIFDANGDSRFPTSNDPNPIINAIDLAAIAAPNNFFLTLTTGGPDSINLRFYQLNFFGQDEWRVRSHLTLSYGLRYEYNTPLREINGRIEHTFSDPLLSLVPGLTKFIAGRTQISDPDRDNFAPRIGLAYTLNPTSRRITVIRAGYGIFYDQILGAVASQSRNVFPSFLTLNFGGGAFTSVENEFPLALYNPSGGRVPVGNQSVPLELPGSLNRLNPNLPLTAYLPYLQANFPSAISPTLPARRLEMPVAQHYAVTLERQLGARVTLSAAYVGTQGRRLLRFTTPNLGPSLNIVPTTFGVAPELFAVPVFKGRVASPLRTTSGIGSINMFETSAASRYNSLQLELRGRFRRSLQYQASYTLSKANDDVSDVFDLAGAFALPQNSLTFAGEWGPANFDIRHRFSYNFIYRIPLPRSRSRLIRHVFREMQIAGTGQFRTGQPFTVNSTIDVNQDGNLTDRLDNTNGLITTGNPQQPLVLTTPNPLSLLAPFGQDGRIGRNTFRAGNVLDLDLAVMKDILMMHGNRLTFRADIFNLANRVNFGIPVRFLEDPGFGKAINTVTPGRRIQVAVKYSF